jgi:hypothetical protein
MADPAVVFTAEEAYAGAVIAFNRRDFYHASLLSRAYLEWARTSGARVDPGRLAKAQEIEKITQPTGPDGPENQGDPLPMSFAVPTDFSQTSSANFEPVPADNHIGICVGVLELGTHMESYQGATPKPVRKIKLQFELPGVDRSDGKTAVISATYNYSLHEKSTFRKLLDGWLGTDWPERSKGKSWDFLLTLPAMVNVESGPSKRDPGRTVSWIANVSKFPKGLPAPTVSRDTVFLDLSAKTLPETLNSYDAEKIRASQEYLAGGFDDRAPRPEKGGYAPANGRSTPPPAAGLGSRPPCPADVVPLLPKYGLSWPFHVEDIPDGVTDADLSVLNTHAIPF